MVATDAESNIINEANDYFPEPESQGGWRWLKNDNEVQSIGKMDPERLQLACEHLQRFDASAGVVIVRHGYVVAEWYESSALSTTRCDIWSATKSFTGTAYGILFEDCRQGKLPPEKTIDLDTPAYQFIPWGEPLTDTRKEKITFRHLLTMTSGIPGHGCGIRAIPTESGVSPFKAALGHAPTKATRWAKERWTNTLIADPGGRWEYSDPAISHLAMAFYGVTGQEMRDFMQERVFGPIGMEQVAWDLQGIGDGVIGLHTNAHTGVHLNARDFARFGYLMLNKGRWNGEQIVPEWWIDLATQCSQAMNPDYGYTWWLNSSGWKWPGVPKDAFAAMGYHCNLCYVVPSLALVVTRVATGPSVWDEGNFIRMVVGSVIE